MPSNTSKKSTTKKSTPAEPIPTQQADPTAKYAPDAWLSGGLGGMEELEVPSGQLCLVRRPGVQGLIAAGVLRNLDSLSSIVSDKHLQKGKKGAPQQVDPSSILKDPKALNEVMHTVDKVTCHCVVQPEVHMTPNDVTRRKPGVVYADMIDIVDKMHIFNFVVGGTRDLESFRSQLDESVGGLEAGEGVRGDAE